MVLNNNRKKKLVTYSSFKFPSFFNDFYFWRCVLEQTKRQIKVLFISRNAFKLRWPKNQEYHAVITYFAHPNDLKYTRT